MIAILAFSILVGPPAETTTFWLRTTPSTSSVSSIVPPIFLTTRMSLRSTFDEVGVTRRETAATAMGASVEEYCETILKYCKLSQLAPVQGKMNTFEFKEVLAARKRLALSLRSTGVDISVRYPTAFVDAFMNDSATMVGWMPFSNIFSAAPSRAPAKTTTEVVPSPASISCAADRSTN